MTGWAQLVAIENLNSVCVCVGGILQGFQQTGQLGKDHHPYPVGYVSTGILVGKGGYRRASIRRVEVACKIEAWRKVHSEMRTAGSEGGRLGRASVPLCAK